MSRMSEIDAMRQQVEKVTGPLVDITSMTNFIQMWYDGLWKINDKLAEGHVVEAAILVERMRHGMSTEMQVLERMNADD